MAFKPKKPCAYPGCPALVSEGRYCQEHKQKEEQRYDKQRGSAASRGYDNRWRQARIRFLKQHPLCECGECKLRPATVVDHKIPHKGDPVLFWDVSNWQAMAKQCHDRKTAKEDGGFGR